MAYVILTLLLTIATLIYAFLRKRYSYWEQRGVAHERPALIFGNMKGIGKTKHFRDINQRIYDRFKGSETFVGMYMFFSKAAMILDLELIKHILIKDFANFKERGIFSNVRDDPLTGHLLTLEGEQWSAMRHKLSPTFTSGKIKYMFPTVVEVGQNLAKVCGDADGGNIELKEVCARFTTDVIGTCAFGLECNSLQDPNAEFRQKGRDIFEKPRHSPAVQAFLITNPKLAQKLRFKLIADDVSNFFLDAVRRTVEHRQKNNIRRNDFMDMLIELKAKDEEAVRHGNGIDLSQGLTLEQMAAQAFVFFVAGFDTSSTTMSLCLYELALNADVQQKLREEIATALAANNNELTYESMNEMVYLEQVLSETLRKYPVLPHLIRKTKSDYRVPNSQHIIQKGVTVLIPVHAMHYDEEYYPEPNKFDPSRFEPEAIEQRHPSTYLPFGDGPRNCIGMRFGKMQAKVGLIALLQQFKFSPSNETEIPLQFSKKNILPSTEHGIHLLVQRIEK